MVELDRIYDKVVNQRQSLTYREGRLLIDTLQDTVELLAEALSHLSPYLIELHNEKLAKLSLVAMNSYNG